MLVGERISLTFFDHPLQPLQLYYANSCNLRMCSDHWICWLLGLHSVLLCLPNVCSLYLFVAFLDMIASCFQVGLHSVWKVASLQGLAASGTVPSPLWQTGQAGFPAFGFSCTEDLQSNGCQQVRFSPNWTQHFTIRFFFYHLLPILLSHDIPRLLFDAFCLLLDFVTRFDQVDQVAKAEDVRSLFSCSLKDLEAKAATTRAWRHCHLSVWRSRWALCAGNP